MLFIQTARATIISEQYNPTDDAQVLSTSPSTNYGTFTNMLVCTGVCFPDIYIGYWKTNIRYTNTNLINATLYLYAPVGTFPIIYTNLTTSSWTENSITWNNRPSVNNAVISSNTSTVVPGWVSFNETNLVRGWINGTYLNYGFNISTNSTGVANFKTKESTLGGYLMINYSFNLTSPLNSSTLYYNYPPLTTPINFTWESLPNQAQLQIANDIYFNVISIDTITLTNYSVQSLSGTQQYFWRVRPYNSNTGIYGGWSNVFNFTLTNNYTTSEKTGINGVIYEILTGTQAPISGATVYISNSTGTWSSSQVVGSNGYYLFDNLTNNTVYYLTAKAQGYDDSQIEYVTTGAGTWTTKNIKLTQCISGQNCFGTQNYVKFIATNFWGNLYSGVSVSVYRGSDITTTYTGTTGTDGSVSFRLTKDQSYTLVFSSSTITTTSITITPGESTIFYVFVSATTPSKYWDNVSYQEVDTVRTGVTTGTSGGVAYVNMTYNDSLAQTTAWTIYLNQTNHTDLSAPQITLQSATGSGNTSTSFSIASGYQGESYLVNIKATHTTFGNIYRSYGVQFYGTKDGSLNFIPSPIMALIAVLILVFTGAFFDSTNAVQGSGIVVVLGWIELGLGMFSYANMYISVGIGLGIASVLVVAANMNERNKREMGGG